RLDRHHRDFQGPAGGAQPQREDGGRVQGRARGGRVEARQCLRSRRRARDPVHPFGGLEGETGRVGLHLRSLSALDGRVAVVTGAGRGLGREHALLLASLGAAVVVNDRGGAPDGSGGDVVPAEAVAAEIRAAGGRAVANADDVADWDGGRTVVETAIEAFGDIHVLVNNAGILRDRFLANMGPDEWDDVVRVHLRGHFVPTRWAAAHWRTQAKAGRDVRASVVNTSSTSGLLGNPGQANY